MPQTIAGALAHAAMHSSSTIVKSPAVPPFFTPSFFSKAAMTS